MTSCAISNEMFLALNCAEERMQVVMGSPQQVLFSEEILCPGQSIRHLHTSIERGLKLANVRVKDLAGIACVRGPGSFTGLRISHASMYGLARPFSIPMAGLEYPSLLATQVAPLLTGEVWVLTHARKAQVYVQGFDGRGPLTGIQPLPLSKVGDLLTSRSGAVHLLGSGLRRNQALLDLPKARILPPCFDTPMPALLLSLACRAHYSVHPPQPLYLRKSDAEDNLESIASSRGISPEEARQNIFDFE